MRITGLKSSFPT